jgi:hypothetical protein
MIMRPALLAAFCAALLFSILCGCAQQENGNNTGNVTNTPYSGTNLTPNMSASADSNSSAANQPAPNNTVYANRTNATAISCFEKGNITAVYFHSRYCEVCVEAQPVIDAKKSQYAGGVDFLDYDTSTAEGIAEYWAYAHAYGIPQNESFIPRAYIGNASIWGIAPIGNGTLDALISNCIENGCPSPLCIANRT